MNLEYEKFVLSLLSNTSKNTDELVARIKELESQGLNPAMLLCAGLGISGEGAEIGDLVKKILFQGKPVDRTRLIKEAGDLEFYLQVLYTFLGATTDEVKLENITKLRARFPNGFTVENSENRKVGDV